ncbi:roadblock/LC7 domain-containing protein [Methanoculleus sp. FWC-SCC1]|uniref:Roadblock/LC7 domain-containing protein n=1 Tax=Methanoculleus frigidifontis TaxID=2584085 RepID=A0ABT8MD01_9EURY|nr:roadblock/LC7 domain-containing protein [Methanoculleus sp. FWC-SCC1]MDN7025811.1 roadblock/LC7 domain-containing protein [Methanoculleus sp. FWC-SCC1]
MIDTLPPGTSIGEMQAPLQWIYSHTVRFIGIAMIRVSDGKGFILIRKGTPLAYYFRHASTVLKGPAAQKYFSQQPLIDFDLRRLTPDEFREAYEVCSVEGVALPPDENGGAPTAPEPDAEELRPAEPEANARDGYPPDTMDLLLQQPGVTAVVRFREGLTLSAAGSVDFEFLAVIAEDLVRWASSLDCVADMGPFVQMTHFYRDGNVLITPLDDDYLCIVTTPGIHFGQIRRLLRDLQVS